MSRTRTKERPYAVEHSHDGHASASTHIPQHCVLLLAMINTAKVLNGHGFNVDINLHVFLVFIIVITYCYY